MIHTFRTIDHPEAGGRQAQVGELQWTLRFVLEDGSKLDVKIGKDSFDTFHDFVLRYDKDEPDEVEIVENPQDESFAPQDIEWDDCGDEDDDGPDEEAPPGYYENGT